MSCFFVFLGIKWDELFFFFFWGLNGMSCFLFFWGLNGMSCFFFCSGD